jgi:hypothetical protein
MSAAYVIESDSLYPRCEAERYRLYGRRGDSLDVLATCGSMEAVGVAIGQLHADAKEVGGTLGDSGAFGLLDSARGEWVISPFRPGESRPAVRAARSEAGSWPGRVVRSRNARKGVRFRVGAVAGPFGFPLEPVSANPASRRLFRTVAELERNWEVVS